MENDVEIGQNSILSGKTHIEEGVIIGPNCLVKDSKISRGSILSGYNVLINALIHDEEVLDYMLCHEDDAVYE